MAATSTLKMQLYSQELWAYTFRQFCVAIQAKDKEQAVLYLHAIYDLHPVNYGKQSLWLDIHLLNHSTASLVIPSLPHHSQSPSSFPASPRPANIDLSKETKSS